MDRQLDDLCGRLGYSFEDRSLLQCALSHRSWCAENGGVPSNERLEYLGDSVLGIAVTESTFFAYPDLSEGGLAKIRASVVNASVLAEVASEYSIGQAVMLGKGEDLSGGREKTSILCDAFEAVIGAIYLDGGWEKTNEFVLRSLKDRIAEAAEGPGGNDYKTLLQEIVAKNNDEGPSYLVVGEGPDHDMRFTADVAVSDAIVGSGEGRTKKQAEQAAARNAWAHFREHSEGEED
ncbi:MAG: ribonuclease III [Actinomycetota bacterium]|nr:ribonuclease III [Actinomycetota bacterium]